MPKSFLGFEQYSSKESNVIVEPQFVLPQKYKQTDLLTIINEMSRSAESITNESYVDVSQRGSGDSIIECYFCIPSSDLYRWGRTCRWMRNHGKRKMGIFWPGPCCK